jgi:creatinine amidohydrolase
VTEHRLGRLTREEALARARAGAVCLLPVGSLEQHGRHLPVGTDSLLVEEVCVRAAAAARVDVLVAPALWTGYSPHHVRFGATVSLSAETFLAVVREVVTGLRAWLPHVVLVNGHGGNRGPLTTLALELGVPSVSYWELAPIELDGGTPGHAGGFETSLVQALAPELAGEPGGEFEQPVAGDPLLVPDMGASGVIGDPRTADADAGGAYLDAVSAALAAALPGLRGSEPQALEVPA